MITYNTPFHFFLSDTVIAHLSLRTRGRSALYGYCWE